MFVGYPMDKYKNINSLYVLYCIQSIATHNLPYKAFNSVKLNDSLLDNSLTRTPSEVLFIAIVLKSTYESSLM